MKIGYVASHYPAPSHTFIQREILELEKLGAEVVRFSVRRSRPEHQLDDVAREEARKTRSLLPPSWELVPALVWLLFTRPGLALGTFGLAMRCGPGVRARIKWTAYFVEAALLAYWLDKDQVRHLHCHFGNAGSNTAWLASKLAGVRFSITFHGIDLDEPETFHHREKLADAVFAVCISGFGKSRLMQGIDPTDTHKIAVVRCGFPLPDDADLPAAPGTGSIICVARLSAEKGHLVLLQALATLAAGGTAFHCTLVGAGPLQGEIEAELTRLGLGQHVTMAGAVANDQVVRMIAASDLSVLASYGEGIPIALLESLAWNRPFVATRVGGIPELAPPGASGLLVEPGDASGLAESIGRLINDASLADQLAHTGRRLVAELHDPEGAARAMLELFRAADPHSPDREGSASVRG